MQCNTTKISQKSDLLCVRNLKSYITVGSSNLTMIRVCILVDVFEIVYKRQGGARLIVPTLTN